MDGRLSPETRRAALAAAGSERFDVAVVGGGVTGAGVALDAAARGLSVLLLEAGDLAAGTSSRSGKTMHGGLRYLEQLNLKLVAGALRERDLTIRVLAPHLVAYEPFLYPLTRRWERPYVGAGVGLYDAMAAVTGRLGTGVPGPHAPRHRHLSRGGALRRAPGLDPDLVTGAIEYPDGRMDDARHTLAVARTAAACGARILTRTEVTGLVTGPDGRVAGLWARDTVTGTDLEVTARVVVNAAGVWAERIQRMAGARSFTVTPAKGAHLLVRGEAFDSAAGILARAEDSVIILRRWYGNWLLGTTDTPYTGDLRRPTVEPADVDYLLRNVNRYLRRPLGEADVLGRFAGLRPLLAPAGGADRTSALSRDHVVLEEPSGLVTVVGGKYTTYRLMARDAVDAAAASLGRPVPPTPTAGLPLVGAAGWRVVGNRLAELARRHGVPEPTLRRMLHRYGDELPEVLAPIDDDPGLARPVPGAAGHLPVEFRYAATHEGALTLTDALERRTHVAIECPDAGRAAAPAVAALLAGPLGWDADRQAHEVRTYRTTQVPHAVSDAVSDPRMAP
jgi:glycerol-3-phosphate dehydrogenase